MKRVNNEMKNLLARNKELENKNYQLSEDLKKANTELEEEKLVHKEENRKLMAKNNQLSEDLKKANTENRKIREKAKITADLLSTTADLVSQNLRIIQNM